MAQTIQISSSKNIFLFTASLVMIFLVSSCTTRKSAFLTSTVVPAAQGNVKIKKDGNNNSAGKENLRCVDRDSRERYKKYWPDKNFF